MKRGAIYTEEKVLYFAAEESSFHIQPTEPVDSDAIRIVTAAVKAGHLRKKAGCAGGEFYEITDKGRIRLLELQIAWRERNGRETREHKARLREALGEQEVAHG